MPIEQRSRIFISYSHEDEPWLKRLLIMLKPATRTGTVTVWTDTQIKPGARWRDEIHIALRQANIAVLLVSPNFLASDFIATEEFPVFLSAAERRGLRILWVPISACLFEMTQIAAYQAMSNPTNPLDALSVADANRELANIARKIVAAVEERRVYHATLEEKLIKAAEEFRPKEDAGVETVSRIGMNALASYGSSREEVRKVGRISPLKPLAVIESPYAISQASMNLAGILIAKAAHSGQEVPQDIWPQLSDLPGIKIDKGSFEIDGYDVIYRAWLRMKNGSEKEIWARVGTRDPSGSDVSVG